MESNARPEHITTKPVQNYPQIALIVPLDCTVWKALSTRLENANRASIARDKRLVKRQVLRLQSTQITAGAHQARTVLKVQLHQWNVPKEGIGVHQGQPRWLIANYVTLGITVKEPA